MQPSVAEWRLLSQEQAVSEMAPFGCALTLLPAPLFSILTSPNANASVFMTLHPLLWIRFKQQSDVVSLITPNPASSDSVNLISTQSP